MSKAKKIFLILVVVVVVAIVVVLGISSGSQPVVREQFQYYSEEQASERLETLKAAQSKHEVEVIPMKFFVEEIRPDEGEFSLTAITTMRVDDIAAVSFRATNSAVPSLEKWYDAENEGNGRYHLSGTAEELGGRSGTYTIEAFITPAGGGETEAGKTEIEMELTNYYYTEALGEGRQSLVLVGPKADTDKEIKGVLFKVWSVDYDQDDIKSYKAKEGPEGVWTAEIDVEDFEGKGDFIANAYAMFEDESAEEVKSGSEAETSKSDAADKDSKTEVSDSRTDTEAKAESEAETSSVSSSETTSVSESEAETSSASSSETASASESETETSSASSEEASSVSESEAETSSASSSETASVSESETETSSASSEEASSVSASEAETKAESEVSVSSAEAEGEEKDKTEEEGKVGKPGKTEIGIASEQFELLPEPMDLPEGAGEVVTEGKRVYVKDVPELIQTPELPTGCESVALTIVLQSMGFKLEKTDIAKNYLAMGTDMATSYVGDPFSKNGAGCFPPAIVNAANKYLEEQKDKREGHNITGESIDDLCDYIDNGLPVILWSSMYMADPAKTGGSYSYQGQTYQWYRSEHCVVLYGYDKEKDVFLVSDPLNGYVERDASAFKNIYDSIGKYAVVIY